MGICINFEGRLDAPDQMGAFVAYLREEARRLGWRPETVRMAISGVTPLESGELRLIEELVRGVVMFPPGTESLSLQCDRSGRLVHYLEIPPDLLDSSAPSSERYFLEMPNWVKTTGAVESHIAIVDLLRRVKTNFVHNLAVDDDTGYWESSDLTDLRFSHHMMSSAIAAMKGPEPLRLAIAAGAKIGRLVQ
ncbi:MAG: hypothetical protein R2762_07310 [Bryobacteraceae bacterium]